MLTIFLRAVILFAAAVAAVRMMGKRQVGQLQPFELVVMIMIAELAATPIDSTEAPLLSGILPMAALMICHELLAFASMGSLRFRKWLCGEPTVLIRHGIICEKQLRRNAITINDLMEMLRVGGVQDPAQVETAVLETGGSVSVFPKAEARAVTPADMGLTPPEEGLPLPLIIDGSVLSHNLERGKLSEAWLREQLQRLGYDSAEAVLLLCLSTSGMLWCQGKGEETAKRMHALDAEAGRW
ncbi:MAG: DUF421 domain-containing protein [Clostridia bacterium]|nr:DUF421 domain-containing protein [Clostridia bacterium]